MSKQGSCVEIDRAVVGNHRWQQWIIGKAAVIEMAYRRRVRSMIHQLPVWWVWTESFMQWWFWAMQLIDWLTRFSLAIVFTDMFANRVCPSLVLPCHHFCFLPFFHFSSYTKSSCRGLGALGLVYFELNSRDIKGTRFGCIFSYSTMTVLLFRPLICWRKSLLNF